MPIELRIAYATPEDLSNDHQQNLRKGRAFVVGAGGLAEREACRIVLVHPGGATLALDAEVVWVKRDEPGKGVGVQLQDTSEAARETLRLFVESPPEPEDEDEPGTRGQPGPRNIHERIRALTLRERETTARQGALPERVALERAFGSSVWEGLLQNPQLTPPEVARIARNGTLPRPLVAVVVQNAGWVKIPEIQRALLSNPRVAGPDMERVLRSLAKSDLERVASLSSYRNEVRQAAKKLLGSR